MIRVSIVILLAIFISNKLQSPIGELEQRIHDNNLKRSEITENVNTLQRQQTPTTYNVP